MGVPADELKERMTEREFRLHRAQMAADPPADERAAHYLGLLVELLNQVFGQGGLIGFKEPPIRREQMRPWEGHR